MMFVNRRINIIILVWILLYILYILFLGFNSYNDLNRTLSDKNRVNKSLLAFNFKNLNDKLIYNPETFERVIISDSSGEVLLQYGRLINGIGNLSFNPIFDIILNEGVAISGFYYDPFLDMDVFDIGILEKNRIYVGTVSVKAFFGHYRKTLDLENIIIFDKNNLGMDFGSGSPEFVNYYNMFKTDAMTSGISIWEDAFYYFNGMETDYGSMKIVTYKNLKEYIFQRFPPLILPFFAGLALFFVVKLLFVNYMKDELDFLHELNHYMENIKPFTIDEERHLPRAMHELIGNYNSLVEEQRRQRSEIKRLVGKNSEKSEIWCSSKEKLITLNQYIDRLISSSDNKPEKALKDVFEILFENDSAIGGVELFLDKKLIVQIENHNREATYIEGVKCTFLNEKLSLNVRKNRAGSLESQSIKIELAKFVIKSLEIIFSYKNEEMRDSLTGVNKFSYFAEQMEREIYNCRRYNYSGSLVLIRIDTFESINAKYGDTVSDVLLKITSEVLIDGIRKGDLIGLYTKGAFMLFLKEISEEVINKKMEEVERRLLANDRIKQMDIEIDLSFSVSTCDEETRDFDSLLSECLQ